MKTMPPIRALFAAAILLALFALVTRTAPARAPAQAETTASAPARTITDETGRRMSIPATVRRIVSLAPDVTETVYALGAGDRLVGDTNYCDTPPEAKLKPHVGNPQSPSLEAVIALHPDLVLASTSINAAETADSLLKLGVPVYTSDPHTILGMLDSAARLGDLIGAKAQGEALKQNLRARLDVLQVRLGDRPLAHVLFLVWFAPPQSIGSNTFIADALRFAGAESVIVSDENWPKPSFEEILRVQPDYIILTTDHEGGATDIADLRSRKDWQSLEAVRLGRVITVSDSFDRPSPGLIDAIEQLARQLHPEAFVAEAHQ
jgi:iron complex transport system substrate-binding protein